MGLFLTDENCIKQREYVNLPAWDGYTGKGITIIHDDAETGHDEAMIDIMQTILPEARILNCRRQITIKNGVVTSFKYRCLDTGETLPFEEFITKYDVSQINNSTDGGDNNSNSPIAVYMRKMIKKYNLFCTGAAGNYGGMTNPYQGAFIMVSGLRFKNGVISDFGSAGDAVDFSMFMGFQDGTSCASAFLNAMGGKLRAKYGRQITQEWIYEYFKSHCQHLGTPGKNPQYGWGVPILGNPETIIKLQIGSDIMTVDGNEVILDQPPEIVRATKRTLVPVRAIAEGLGATVAWDEKTKIITIVR